MRRRVMFDQGVEAPQKASATMHIADRVNTAAGRNARGCDLGFTPPSEPSCEHGGNMDDWTLKPRAKTLSAFADCLAAIEADT
jgi:hypothetical protein